MPMTKGYRIDASKLELATAREKQTTLNNLKRAWMIRYSGHYIVEKAGRQDFLNRTARLAVN